MILIKVYYCLDNFLTKWPDAIVTASLIIDEIIPVLFCNVSMLNLIKIMPKLSQPYCIIIPSEETIRIE